MVLENKLGITNSADLAKEEEKLSKKRAVELFEEGLLSLADAGSFSSLLKIHEYLFKDIYDFAGNEWEWTLEKTPDTSAPCVRRGACFDNAGSIRPASRRGNETRTIKNGGIAFRSTLY